MSLKKTETSIDLSGLDLVNVSEEKKVELKRTREGFTEKMKPVLTKLAASPELLPVDKLDYKKMLEGLKEAMVLEEALAWLENKQEMVEETLRLRLSGIKEQVDQANDVARPLAQHRAELASLFADYWDWLASPRKKAEQTKKKQNKATDQDPS